MFFKITKARNQARSDDTNKIKFSILNLFYEDPKIGSKFKDRDGFQALLPHDPKDSRGFKHLDTADLLCPLRLQDDFQADPK
jgi:hypothetical protein